MKIGATADLHGYLPYIPDNLDLLLIAGDIGLMADHRLEAFSGRDRTLEDFEAWLDDIPCPVIGIAGNHDFGLAGPLNDRLAHDLSWTYLRDETTLVGDIVIYGSPWTPTYGPWAYMQDDILLADKWAQIPDDVDILLTHGPPLGVMDVGHGGVPAGSATLRQRLLDIDPVLHVFGHIHGSRGVIEEDTKTTANAAYVDEAYKPVGIMEFDV